MLRQVPFLSRFYSKLVYELLPGAVISALGGLLLNQYYIKPAAPVAVTVNPANSDLVAAIHVEQTRLIDYLAKTEPRAGDATEAGPRATPRPVKLELKTARADKTEKRVAPKPPRQIVEHQAPVGPPLQLAQITIGPTTPAAQPMPAPAPVAAMPAPPNEDNGIMARLRSATAAVQDIPSRIRAAVTFDDSPPRPPAPILGGNFLKASM